MTVIVETLTRNFVLGKEQNVFSFALNFIVFNNHHHPHPSNTIIKHHIGKMEWLNLLKLEEFNNADKNTSLVVWKHRYYKIVHIVYMNPAKTNMREFNHRQMNCQKGPLHFQPYQSSPNLSQTDQHL